MNTISLRVLDGPDRGSSYTALEPPVTIGRERGNTVVLDDERISRCHLKIFEENGLMILVDLDSTNGTRVNGENTQMWALRPGDLIMVGNIYLVYGSRNEIAERLVRERQNLPSGRGFYMGITPGEAPSLSNTGKLLTDTSASTVNPTSDFLQDELFAGLHQEDLLMLRVLFPPKLPKDLTASQVTQLSQALFYYRLRLRILVDDVHAVESGEVSMENFAALKKAKGDEVASLLARQKSENSNGRVTLSFKEWQNILDVYATLTEFLDSLSHPI